MPAPRSLDSLPFDVFYQIATSLDDRDCINLSRTNSTLHDFMESDLIARKTVKNTLLYSKEGQSAWAAQTGFRKAVGHRFDIHEAIATAAPYSVSVLAYGADFLYNQGVLCYRVGYEIRLLDVHRAGRHERVLNLGELIPRLGFGPAGLDVAERVTLLHYNEGIVSFRLERVGAQEDALLAIDMDRRSGQPRRKRLLLQKAIPADSPIFVHHSRSYIWYGTFTSAHGSSGVWSVCGKDFATSEEIEFPLDRIVDGDLGQTLCFEMYQEHLYAVSTQVASDDDERFSSFYHWFCYTPGEKSCKWSGRVWRREHREGPINEMWTDLSIRIDETNGRPVILECRREWRGGKSENHRTNYIEPLPTPEEAKTWVDDDPNDPTGNHQPYNQRPEKRLRRNYHAEYEHNHDPKKRLEFIAARTKHRSYHLASATFVDLVNDPAPQADGVRSQDRLRLRTVSRKRKTPIDDERTDGARKMLFRSTQVDGQSVDGSEDRFVSRGVHMWPHDDTPSEIYNILCPDSRVGSVRAVSDERSIIYSVSSAGLPSGHQALILISFDPTIRFPNLTSLRTMKSSVVSENMFSVEVPRPQSLNSSLVQEATPLYQAIRRGYWLR
ncbi:Carboxylesterase type B [Penicillium atrosanguineum]|uniref:Carboxylesterase type B n=1 Tax=Penicillium atrosanguineum TaxID=1132637 RepID=UPI0023972C39|nr:Carboxylesterase type B [Penicillium atrosanguineum]KAJ5119181.1 hypothetical protein N7526_010818 [Penicillium atrosanguineum]KAJ5297215.1 Carboxylesterase type B [Penicillium atrosanguineum]